MDGLFVEYLLGALDPATHQRVEAHLTGDAGARARLNLLSRALAPLAEDAEPPVPPPGLALATLARIAERSLPSAPPSRGQLGNPSRRWRLVDWMVAAVLLLLVGALGLPLVAGLWRRHQQAACADNLRRYGTGLQAYATQNNDEFPRVEETGHRAVAGMFVPILTGSGLLGDVSVECPARGIGAPRDTVEGLKQQYENDRRGYDAAVRRLSGHYAYCLGYQDGGRLFGLRRDSGDDLPILADRPEGEQNSANHAGTGQNVLFVGGHVRWCVSPTVGVEGDHIYMNQQCRVRAGLSKIDTVLAPGETRPFQE